MLKKTLILFTFVLGIYISYTNIITYIETEDLISTSTESQPGLLSSSNNNL